MKRWTDWVNWGIGTFFAGVMLILFWQVIRLSDNPIGLLYKMLMTLIAVVLFIALFVYGGRIFDRTTHKALDTLLTPPRTHDKNEPYRQPFVNYRFFRPFTDIPPLQRGEIRIEDDFAILGDLSFSGEQVRWISGVDNNGIILLDLEVDGIWYSAEIRTAKQASKIHDDLRQIVPNALTRKKHMQRPNTRYEAKEAYVAKEVASGQWDEKQAVSLYVTPRYLVVFRNGIVWYSIDTDTIKNLEIKKHPSSLIDEALLMTFRTNQQDYAFTVYDEVIGQALNASAHAIPLAYGQKQTSNP